MGVSKVLKLINGLNNFSNKLQLINTNKLHVVLFIFYTVGIVGFYLPCTFSLFVNLISYTLLVNFTTAFLFNQLIINKLHLSIFFSIYFIGFIIEAIGVNYGFIFGHYNYGTSLGLKLFNTPLIIGINWLFLTYCTYAIFQNTKWVAWLKIIGAATCMLLFDFVIENVAPKLQMWEFLNNQVPLQNYIAWFIISLVFQTTMWYAKIQVKNKIAVSMFLYQFIFFLILTFIK